MTETKLPTIENFESGELTLRGILNAHEQYYKKLGKKIAKAMIKATGDDYDRLYQEMHEVFGSLKAVQSLRGKK